MGRTQKARIVLERLRAEIPQPQTELEYGNRFQLLVAVILSAQCTDQRVNKVTPALFEAYPTASAMARASEDEIRSYIGSVTFPNSKSKYLYQTARTIVELFEGRVPSSMEDLQQLPGVGRKSAQVVMAVGFDRAALAVDTHVFRVSRRLGLVRNADTPLKVERQLKRIIPRPDWADAHHLLILHGRYTCTARSPSCGECELSTECRHYRRRQSRPAARTDLNAANGAYFCTTCDRYFDEPAVHEDRYGIEQTACPRCNSMQVLVSRSGEPAKKIPDPRIRS